MIDAKGPIGDGICQIWESGVCGNARVSRASDKYDTIYIGFPIRAFVEIKFLSAESQQVVRELIPNEP